MSARRVLGGRVTSARAVLVVGVLAAMALGRVISDHVAVGTSDVDPFVTQGRIGSAVHLTYADVTVDRIAGAKALDGVSSRVLPAGQFVVVDVTFLATKQPTAFESVYLLDADARRYVPTTNACATRADVPTRVAWHARFCFDVPKKALPGIHLLVARGDFGTDKLRRDAVAEIDLRLDQSAANRVWESSLTIDGLTAGPETLTPPGVKK